jgi:hypothetical protein
MSALCQKRTPRMLYVEYRWRDSRWMYLIELRISVLIANLNVLNFTIVDYHVLPARSTYCFSIDSFTGEGEIEKNDSRLNLFDAVHIPTHCFEAGEKLRLHIHNLISAKVNRRIRGTVGARRREQLLDIR